MAAPYTDIKHLESKLADLMTDNELSPRDIERACDYLGAILGDVFKHQEQKTGFRSWAVDDLWPEKHKQTDKKLILSGKVFWLNGGGKCTLF